MLAFLFPGQGAQVVGMGRDLAASHEAARRVFERADEVLGYALSRLCFEGPEPELTLTCNAQPALLCVGVAALRVVEAELGWAPDILAGHSLGEFSALVAAGAVAFEDAVRLVHLRGRFMQEAVPPGVGAMAALIGLDMAQVQALCAEAAQGEVLAPANDNGGGQIVVAGHRAAVERAMSLAQARGARRAIPLQVSAPFHCPLMEPAAARLDEELARIRFENPRVPVVSNVEARANSDGGRLRALLRQQVTAPVRWAESVQTLVALGATVALELGPGRVLAGLVRRIAPSLKVRPAGTTAQITALLTDGKEALA